MTIHYVLHKNRVVEGATDYVARVCPVDSADMERVADLMVERGSTITKADILAVQEDTLKIVEQLLQLGFRVNMGLCSLYPVIKGRFEDSDASFDPAIHKLGVNSTAGIRIKNYVKGNVNVEKGIVSTIVPTVTSYTDTMTGEKDLTITPGSIGAIKGMRLKYDHAIADEGVFLLSDGQPDVQVDIVQKNTAQQIVFQVPLGLLAGTIYQLVVRARYTEGGTLREGMLLAELETPA